ncbi:MAG: sigma-70 family RNA polymerase sigma factor [Actinomycetia bacterium]|nr:sigma-70 family RNA polymerase sigma factor [Actinomycetes bacterium]
MYQAAYSRLVGLAYLTTGTNALAEEIVQDAFVDLFRSWHAVRQPEAWVRRAVVSRCTSWVRRRALERRHRDQWCGDEPIVHDELAVAVRSALHVLSPRQRVAVVLRFRDDLSEAEIASALGCRPGTVKSLWRVVARSQ